ncbi:hypothetical protein B0T25DRAFT_526158 [Lasiosphaeria hispida]|uniref:Secreted protein n=1 Tax=Lasiosphaeria hispida TaxID=260671 RepID=A0AAJ0HV08_9PEZI|nr:hypothetical protein B0T25DRAFT_526158 [Lasiosphaeria hispida]
MHVVHSPSLLSLLAVVGQPSWQPVPRRLIEYSRCSDLCLSAAQKLRFAIPPPFHIITMASDWAGRRVVCFCCSPVFFSTARCQSAEVHPAGRRCWNHSLTSYKPPVPGIITFSSSTTHSDRHSSLGWRGGGLFPGILHHPQLQAVI